ncbi:MAG: diacylglycerol kinase [Proteobacteria bacterium]|nr:diacylglycerol kinase [Pseudomonadota bacterium]NOG61502.1 diacylglycerol kinase [Pseudomonadota bacterium]
MAEDGKKGIKRLYHATIYSWQGFKAAYKSEEAFKQEVFLCIILIPLGLYLGQNGIERAILIGAALLIPIVELLNTGIEVLTDRVGTEHHKLSGRAKDIGSAAVLLSLINAAVVWILVLFN